ncbi:hypothetical protein BP6252_07327 [Coleophoma cylindrospora]|uniref:WW domain-containing protein n=1 Tax=Coleophoma cylindrospora TaxID=1849047 RepID=A0A3D8RHG9_9HELO|nr:hypothetical protein BP6252_07327 [Coleophoma cylindrospora]
MRRLRRPPPPPPPPPLPPSLPPPPSQARELPLSTASGDKKANEEGELPSGWEEIIESRTGRTHYLDHNRKIRTTVRPPPAIKSTVSQDFTAGITNAIELNLLNFSGSARRNLRQLTIPDAHPRNIPISRKRPAVFIQSDSSSSPSPSPSPSASPSANISPSQALLLDQPILSVPRLGISDDCSESKQLGHGLGIIVDQRTLELNDTMESTQKAGSSMGGSVHEEAKVNSHSCTAMNTASLKHGLDSVEHEVQGGKRLKATTSVVDISPSPNILDASTAHRRSDEEVNCDSLRKDHKKSDHHKTVHTVLCEESRSGAQIYEDVPKPIHRPGHLLGEKPIFDMKDYLENYPGVAFVAYNEYFCRRGCRGEGNPYRRSKLEIQPAAREQLLKPPSPTSENIAIISPKLRRAIEDIATCSAGSIGTYEFEGFLVFSKPYQFFFHHLSRLGNIANSIDIDNDTSAQVSWLLDYLSVAVGELFDKANDLFARGLVSPECLPLLFCPNELLISKENDIYIAAVLRDWPATDLPIVPSASSLPTEGQNNLNCWTWGPPNSSGMGRRLQILKVERVIRDDKVKITDLLTYPSRFASKKVLDSIKNRGQAFWNLRFPKLVSYSGWDFQLEQNHINTRFMIDYCTYRKLHPFASIFDVTIFAPTPPGYKLIDKRPLNLSIKEDPSDESLMILPPNVHGFDLKEKKWLNLSVDNVKEVEWNTEAFKLLVLPKPTKDLIQALVEIRASKDDMSRMIKRQDIMSGKGQGLIMLLHGGPGTGKTLTAERYVGSVD